MPHEVSITELLTLLGQKTAEIYALERTVAQLRAELDALRAKITPPDQDS